MDIIHGIVKSLRLQNNMSLKEVGFVLGVSEATVQRYESGKGIKDIPYDKIIAYSELFGVSPNYLVTGVEEKPTVPKFDSAHIELIDLYSRLNEEQKNSILTLMRSMVN